VNKVVFMGMGEPAHNLDNVLEAIELLGTVGNIGHKNLVFSTVGDPRVFERLPLGRVKPALALSLHTTDAALRARLLPRAPRIDPADLVEQGDAMPAPPATPFNTSGRCCAVSTTATTRSKVIARLLAGRYAILNLIPYNAVEGLPFERPSWERAAEMARALRVVC
jgi:23S rRNA (adenine2503-C2)-methyltransferase